MMRPHGPNCWTGLGAFNDRVLLKHKATLKVCRWCDEVPGGRESAIWERDSEGGRGREKGRGTTTGAYGSTSSSSSTFTTASFTWFMTVTSVRIHYRNYYLLYVLLLLLLLAFGTEQTPFGMTRTVRRLFNGARSPARKLAQTVRKIAGHFNRRRRRWRRQRKRANGGRDERDGVQRLMTIRRRRPAGPTVITRIRL